MYWARHHLNHLKNWRGAVEAVAKAAKGLGLEIDMYVVGGAAEDRLTVRSDVDVLVCVNAVSGGELGELRRRILIEAMDRHGLPWDYPIELHIIPKGECGVALKRFRKFIKIS